MLWTAWPLAPLTRLSSALMTMSRPVRGSSRQAISIGQVPVFWDAVRPDAFIAFAEQVIDFGFSAGATDAAEGIGDDARRLDEAGLEQRDDWHQDAGRITSWRRDEQRIFDLFPMDFRQ